jgi:site-specific DNA recombinase
MKAIILARVSTEEQKEAGNSLPAQLERMRSYCSRNGYEVEKEYSWSETAYKVKRDEFDNILDDIKKTKEKIIICFDKVDRLSRNIFDKRVAFLYEKAIADVIELHFVSDGQTINSQMNAGDKFAFGMKLGLAKYYSDAISDNVKRSAEQRRAEGKRVGGIAPLGYLNTIDDNEKKTITADPDRSHLVQKMFELYSTGNYSLKAMTIEAKKMGLTSKQGNTLSLEAIRRILINPFYYGIQTSTKYEAYAHKYIKLITKELFNKCQDVANRRSNKYTKIVSSPFIFKGLLTCDNCGCAITPERHTKKSGKVFIYYSCTNYKKTCKKEYINEKKLLEPIYKLLDGLASIDTETQEYITQKLRETSEMEVIYHKKQIARIRKEEDSITKRKDKLLDMLLDESITQEAYDKKLLSLKEQQGLLHIEIKEHTNGNYNFLTTVGVTFSLAKRAREIFDSSETEEKRQLLNYLLQNPVIKSKKLYFTTKKPFNMLLNIPKGLVLGDYRELNPNCRYHKPE